MVAAALALPAGAVAQSAGDNQYVDPLAGQSPTTSHTTTTPSHTSSGSSSGSGTSAPAPAPVAPSTSAGTATAAPAQTASAPQSGSVGLARTGFDAWIPAVGGVLLLGLSLLVRRSARRHA